MTKVTNFTSKRSKHSNEQREETIMNQIISVKGMYGCGAYETLVFKNLAKLLAHMDLLVMPNRVELKHPLTLHINKF